MDTANAAPSTTSGTRNRWDTPVRKPQDAFNRSQYSSTSTEVVPRTKVTLRGTGTDQSSVADILMCKGSRLPKLSKLWFARTPHVLKGTHDKEGNFTSVECVRADQDFENWETENQVSMRKLVSLLHEIKRTMSDKIGVAMLVSRASGRPLEMLRVSRTVPILPVDTIREYFG
ncbi:hypothetical protein BDV96DRAFT_95078 [Lophiotrema nucula]|uniref:Uncharacterized protein n=1 Tax=Lophiotrema nucula TaxID=690887 RepID=A0A6A5Z4K6_9PLEO|nr:hypothetical protein BDV96DRAFT_95078 [Lophiotrema nucula]